MNTINPSAVALITGASRRIGAVIAEYLHQQGLSVVLHYRSSRSEVEQLAKRLNHLRQDSAVTVQADLLQTVQLPQLIANAAAAWGRLDILVNNASSYFPTIAGATSEQQWDDLFGSNLKAPYFLMQSAVPWLQKVKGSIINITDVNAHQPVKGYAVYSVAKAGLWMLTRALAQDLAPDIRVNAIAPGTIIWPEGVNAKNAAAKNSVMNKIPLQRIGEPLDIAKAVWFLIAEGNYITGQEIRVDGGKSIRGFLD